MHHSGYDEKASDFGISLIISTWKEPKIQLSEWYTASESSVCVCACVCIYINVVVMPRLPCLPESSRSNSDSSPFSPQASLSPRAAEDDEVQLVRMVTCLQNIHTFDRAVRFLSPNQMSTQTDFPLSRLEGSALNQLSEIVQVSGSVPAKAQGG